ncbi:MAG: DEAD/DEAH box helicase family protein [Bacteroides sp.]|nr:DEAD/DEAH box helicase family protein [Bacteroides sp.]
MEIIDNIDKTLKDDMMATLRSGSKVAIAASSFSIYAFQELKEQLEDISELRFIFTSPSFITEKADKQKREFYIPRLNRERNLYGSEFEIKLRNELSLKAVAKECAEWIRKKACFKSNRTNAGMPAFATVDDTTYMPLNGFTTVELGCERGDNLATAITKMETPFTQQYLRIFNQIWNDGGQLQVVTEQVLDNITNAYRENSPEFIYFVTLYNIFNEFLEDISEDVLPNEATGFKSSVIWNKLYNFQKDAALAIINKLENYNGCILADSVGLGKTFTALSVIQYYGNRNKSVLILCPKKLHDNWVTYRSNYKNNPLVADRMRRLCRGKSEPISELCRKFNAETRDGQRMGTYSRLLGDAISSLIATKETTDLFSFLEGDSGSLFGNEVKGLDDFELICFLVIR